MSDSLQEKIQAARFKLVDKHAPYLSRAIWSVTLVESPGMLCPHGCKDLADESYEGCATHGTMGVDKNYRLYYDPGIAEKWDVDLLVAVLAHETHHLLRMHADRQPMDSGMVWNLAGDCEINDDLTKEFPAFQPIMKKWGEGATGFLAPSTFGMAENETAEEYYNQLLSNKDLAATMQASADGKGDPMKVDCGSAASGKPRDYELPSDDPGAPGKSEIEKELIRKQVAQDVKEHIKSTGSDPMGLGRWADDILDSKVDWRKELYAKIRNSVARARGSNDYTYKNPNFRRSTGEFILPSLYEPVPNITVVVDTSGSISQKELAQAIAEINGIFKKCNANEGVTVISCDADVHLVKKVYSAKQIESLPGGGGTDMGKGIQRADELRSQVTVILTDGYTPWPKEAPRTQVIVGLIGNTDESGVPEWAKVVLIQD